MKTHSIPPVVRLLAALSLFVALPSHAAPTHALTFDGVNDYVETNSGVIPTSGNFTVEFWADCPVAPASYRDIISQGSGANQFYIGTDPSNNIRLGPWVPSPAIPYPVGGWHRFALVRSSADTRFYIDGVLKASMGSAMANPAASTGLRLGRQNSSGGEYWSGSIGDVRVWNRDLGAGELHHTLFDKEPNLVSGWDFHEASGTTCTSVGSTSVVGTLLNGPFWTAQSSLNLISPLAALSFDGVDDYVETGTAVIPSSGDFTVEVWAECPAAPNSYREIISQGGSGNAFYIGSTPANTIRIGDTWGTLSPAVPMPIGGWHHFAVVKSSSNTLLYIDGVLKASRGSAISNPASSGLRFGRQYGYGGPENWQGNLSEVRICSSALAYSQLGRYLSSSDAPVVASWSFMEAFSSIPWYNCTSQGNLEVVGTLVNGPTWLLPQYSFQDNGTSITIRGNSPTAIGDLVIPETISGKPVTTIETGAFSRCNLTSVVLPATITTIRGEAFQSCGSLHSVEFLGNAPSLGSGAFANVAADFVVKYHNGTTGFTSPTWHGFRSYNIDTSPEIEVEQNIPLTDGASTVYFGTVPQGMSSTLTFTIRNTGKGNLTGLAVSVTGPDANTFTVGNPGATSVPTGGSTTFTLSFAPGRFGGHAADIHITSNDMDENPFDIPISATCQFLIISDNGSSITIAAAGPLGIIGSLYIPSNLNGKPVTSISNGAFSGNNSLQYVIIPSSISSIGVQAFANCVSLGQIEVDAANPNFSSLDGVLFNKTRTTLIQCPGGRTGSYTIPSSVTGVGVRSFNGCEHLTNVTIPPSVTTLQDRAFLGCISLLNATIPSSVSSIATYTFFRCTALDAFSVDAANPVYSSANGVLFDKLKTTLIQCPGNKAGAYAVPTTVINIAAAGFSECAKLTSVSIPASVTSMGIEVFPGCGALNAITVDAANPSFSSADGLLFNKAKTSIIQCPGNKSGSYAIPASVTSIETWAFAQGPYIRERSCSR